MEREQSTINVANVESISSITNSGKTGYVYIMSTISPAREGQDLLSNIEFLFSKHSRYL